MGFGLLGETLCPKNTRGVGFEIPTQNGTGASGIFYLEVVEKPRGILGQNMEMKMCQGHPPRGLDKIRWDHPRIQPRKI
jgi:hypothetical protein